MSGTLAPLVQQGTLNRLRASVIVTGFTNLNVTSSYLGRAGIGLTFTGDATLMIDTMTGMVTSPEPYLAVDVVVHLLRTQNLGLLWRQQMESVGSVLGNVNVVPDSSVWTTYNFVNAAITAVNPGPQSGTDPTYMVTLRATYPVNTQLFNLQ